MSRVSKSSKEEQGEEEDVEEEDVEEEGESWNIGGMEESMGSLIETGWLSSS